MAALAAAPAGGGADLASAFGADSLMVAANGTPTLVGEIHTADISKALKPKSPWDLRSPDGYEQWALKVLRPFIMRKIFKTRLFKLIKNHGVSDMRHFLLNRVSVLEELNLERCSIGDEGSKAIHIAIKTAIQLGGSAIKKLHLSHNKISRALKHVANDVI